MTTWASEPQKGEDKVVISTNSADMTVVLEATRGGYVKTEMRMSPRLATEVRDLIDMELARQAGLRKVGEDQDG